MATGFGDANDPLDYGDYYESLFAFENITFSEFIKKMEGPKIVIQFWMWPFFFWATFTVGILGNLMVAYIIIRKKEMWTRTNFYLLNLSIADSLYLLTAIPSSTYWTNYWPIGQFWCKFFLYYFNFVSIKSVSAIFKKIIRCSVTQV